MVADIFANPVNITGLVPLIRYVNTLTVGDGTTGLLGIAILVMVGFVTFLSTKGYSADRSLAYTSFLCFIVAILLRFLNLISDGIMILMVILMVGSIIFLIKERNAEGGAV